MSTGENEQGLRSVVDFTRLLSIAILILHFYTICYPAFRQWRLTAAVTDHIINHLAHLPFFRSILIAKLTVLLLLVVFLLGIKGKKDEKATLKQALILSACGLVLYFLSQLFLFIPSHGTTMAIGYMLTCSMGYLMMVSGGTYLSRIIKVKLTKDIFNKENETFPQEERLLENEYSVNFPARYQLKGATRNSFINIVNPFRGLLVSGSPGS